MADGLLGEMDELLSDESDRKKPRASSSWLEMPLQAILPGTAPTAPNPNILPHTTKQDHST